jgi:hypothetical protein
LRERDDEIEGRALNHCTQPRGAGFVCRDKSERYCVEFPADFLRAM